MSSPTGRAAAPAHGRPARASLLGGRSGLTTTGATALVLLVGAAGGVVDVVTGNGLRLVFAGCLVAAATLGALLVERHRLLSSVVLVPLVYVVLAVTADVAGSGGSLSGASAQAVAVLNAVILGAPTLLAATGAAGLVAALRAAGSRKR